MLNSVVLIGRLVKDVELRYLPTGNNTAVAKFTLAVDRQLSKERREVEQQAGRPTADFIRCVAWGNTAETLSSYTDKGKLLGVQGRIQTGSYKNQAGDTVYTTEVVVEKLSILEWGDRSYTKGERTEDAPMEGFEDFKYDDSTIPF